MAPRTVMAIRLDAEEKMLLGNCSCLELGAVVMWRPRAETARQP